MMKSKVQGVALLGVALLFTASTALAADLNVAVQRADNGMSATTVGPDCVVNYQVVGTLSDTNNEGLALVGFDLTFSGGALSQANEPSSLPMSNFDIPDGITNPAGFGGTMIGGSLVQVGGGQNTIKNTLANADFPVGTVITNVAHTQEVLVTGSLTAPSTPGVYTLSLTNLFANVIKDGETGAVFWATEQANAGTITNLTITVEAGQPCDATCVAVIVSSDPPSNAIDARQPHDINSNAVPQGFTTVEVTMPDCAISAGVVAADFTVTEVNGSGGVPTVMSVSPVDADSVMLTLSAPIQTQAWTVITHDASGSQICLGALPADANGNRTANAQDITALINSLNNVPGQVRPIYATDSNRNGVANAQDITQLINLLNGASAFDPWINQTIPVSPCP